MYPTIRTYIRTSMYYTSSIPGGLGTLATEVESRDDSDVTACVSTPCGEPTGSSPNCPDAAFCEAGGEAGESAASAASGSSGGQMRATRATPSSATFSSSRFEASRLLRRMLAARLVCREPLAACSECSSCAPATTPAICDRNETRAGECDSSRSPLVLVIVLRRDMRPDAMPYVPLIISSRRRSNSPTSVTSVEPGDACDRTDCDMRWITRLCSCAASELSHTICERRLFRNGSSRRKSDMRVEITRSNRLQNSG